MSATIDFHYHMPTEQSDKMEFPMGCLISRSSRQNEPCVQEANSKGVACALHIDCDSAARSKLFSLISFQITYYFHCEILGYDMLRKSVEHMEVAPKLPIILHLSTHKGGLFSERDAARCLQFMCDNFKDGHLIISHLGGENCEMVMDYTSKHKNILLDLSCTKETAVKAGYFEENYFVENVLTRIAVDQLLYGSDLIVGENAGNSHSAWKNHLSEADTNSVYFENARMLLLTAGFEI